MNQQYVVHTAVNFMQTVKMYVVKMYTLQFYCAAGRGEEYCGEHVSLSVCVCVCVCVCLSSELHVRSSPKFLCILARSSSCSAVIRYVLPIL